MTNYTKKAVKGFTIIFIMTVLGAVAGYLYRLVLTRNLSVSEYGLFYSVYSFMFVLFIIKDLGLGQAISKYVPELLTHNDIPGIKFILLFSTAMTVFVSTGLLLFTTLASGLISSLYLKSPGFEGFIILFGLTFFFFALEALIAFILSAFQKHILYSVFQFLRQFIALIFLMIIFLFTKDVTMALYSYIFSSFIMIIFFLVTFKMVMPDYKKHSFSFNKILSKDLTKFGISVLLISIGGLVLQSTDTIMLTIYKTTADVGIYNVALPIANLLIYFGSALSVVLIPMTSELVTRKMEDKLEMGLKMLYKYSVMTIVPACIIIIAYAEIIINILFGQEYVSGANALRILIFGTLFFLLSLINFSVLSGLGKPGVTAKIMLVGAIINIILNIILIPLYGITGAAIATATSYLIIAIFSIIYLKKSVDIKLPILHWIKSILISIIMLAIIIYLKNIIKTNLFLEIAIIVAISLAAYLGLSLATRQIDRHEIKHLYQLITMKRDPND